MSSEKTFGKYYLLGAILGDGCFNRRIKTTKHTLADGSVKTYKYLNERIAFQVKDKEFMDKFLEELESTYNIRAPLWLYDGLYCTEVNNREVFNDLKSISNEDFLNLPIEAKCAFLRGFFDAEGCVYLPKHSLYPRIKVGNTNAKLMAVIREVLESLDIHPSYHILDKGKWKDFYELSIAKRKSIDIFRNLIGFTINRKKQILNIVKPHKVKQCKTKQPKNKEPKLKQPKIKQLRMKKAEYIAHTVNTVIRWGNKW